MSTEPTERDPVTGSAADEPHVQPPSLAGNATHAVHDAAAAVAARPPRHRAPAQIAGVVLPAWAPWAAVLGAAVVMGLISLATGFNWGLFVVGTVILGGIGLYAWSRAVEGP